MATIRPFEDAFFKDVGRLDEGEFKIDPGGVDLSDGLTETGDHDGLEFGDDKGSARNNSVAGPLSSGAARS